MRLPKLNSRLISALTYPCQVLDAGVGVTGDTSRLPPPFTHLYHG